MWGDGCSVMIFSWILKCGALFYGYDLGSGALFMWSVSAYVCCFCSGRVVLGSECSLRESEFTRIDPSCIVW